MKDADVGKESRRAYVDYEHTKKPDPGYLKQILENSFNELEMAHFCEYFIRLLNCRIKKHKEKVMCLVGEPKKNELGPFNWTKVKASKKGAMKRR